MLFQASTSAGGERGEHRQGQGSGTSDTELSTAPGAKGAGLGRRGCPGAGVSLTALTTEAAPGSLQLPGCCPSAAFPVPLVSHWPWSGTRQVKSSHRGGFAPRSEQLPPCSSAFIQSCSAQPHGWLRDKPGITPSLISKEPRPGQTWLFWLRKDRGTCPSLTQHSHSVHSTALGGPRCTGRAEQGAQGSDPRGFCPFPLQQQRSTGSHTPPAPQWGPSSSHSLQVKTLGYLLNAI